MKTRITIGAVMLLSLGSALAGSMMYSKGEPAGVFEELNPSAVSVDALDVTPEMIAKWKATAATTEYSPPMLPM